MLMSEYNYEQDIEVQREEAFEEGEKRGQKRFAALAEKLIEAGRSEDVIKAAQDFLMSNEDENKVFYIGFRTPPDDSTGLPHILEHSVLEGSDKFPVKDPFVELVKGSLNTFLNAMTYPDKTYTLLPAAMIRIFRI